jgi:hypothetical protein
MDLCDGRIICREQALRLVLVMDYIFDWAADIYRENILRGLQSRAALQTSNLTYKNNRSAGLDYIRPCLQDEHAEATTYIHTDQGAVIWPSQTLPKNYQKIQNWYMADDTPYELKSLLSEAYHQIVMPSMAQTFKMEE